MYQAFIRFTILLLALSIPNSTVALHDIIAGKHYKVMPAKLNSNPDIAQFRANDKNKVQVLFFFNYGCHVCGMLNKPFDNWSKGKPNISTYHVPVTSRGLESLSKAYFTASALDKTGKIDDAIFAGIHQKRINYSRVSLLEKLFIQHGVSKELFNQTFNSFAVARQIQQADDLARAYSVIATPIIIINTKNKIYRTSLVFTKNIDTLLQTIDFIVNK